MRSILAATVLLAGLIASGCYESTFPLDRTPQTDIPSAAVGVWRCLPGEPDENDDAITVTVKRARDRVYDVTLQETGQDPDKYEAFASSVKGAPIINLKDLDPGADKPWSFLRVALLRPNVMDVQVFSETAIGSATATPASVRQLLEATPEKPGLFEPAAVCVRVKK